MYCGGPNRDRSMPAAAISLIEPQSDRIFYSGQLQGRFYREAWYETERHSYLPTAVTRSLAPDEVVFVCDEFVETNDRAFIYLSGVGLIRGLVRRNIGPVIYLGVDANQNETARLTTHILWLSRLAKFSANDRRVFPRYVPRDTKTTIELPGEKEKRPCHLVNISPTGAAVESDLRPDVGSKVILGTIHGAIARHFETGFAVGFSTIQDPATLEAKLCPSQELCGNVLNLSNYVALRT